MTLPYQENRKHILLISQQMDMTPWKYMSAIIMIMEECLRLKRPDRASNTRYHSCWVCSHHLVQAEAMPVSGANHQDFSYHQMEWLLLVSAAYRLRLEYLHHNPIRCAYSSKRSLELNINHFFSIDFFEHKHVSAPGSHILLNTNVLSRPVDFYKAIYIISVRMECWSIHCGNVWIAEKCTLLVIISTLKKDSNGIITIYFRDCNRCRVSRPQFHPCCFAI